ncbi:hypothetical protein B296_00009301 [Ensete ventricosum]|uniref:Uncharacterized protein n=1 Tax=Ensete ventricosum TaxID=4639 RepID=A0A427B878_ENSVE|nr:hypothetical protein B296_00009301 [Ensete ventricosum]
MTLRHRQRFLPQCNKNRATSASYVATVRPPLHTTEVPSLPATSPQPLFVAAIGPPLLATEVSSCQRPLPYYHPPPPIASLPFPTTAIPLPSLLPTSFTSPAEERTVVHRGDMVEASHTANNDGRLTASPTIIVVFQVNRLTHSQICQNILLSVSVLRLRPRHII